MNSALIMRCDAACMQAGEVAHISILGKVAQIFIYSDEKWHKYFILHTGSSLVMLRHAKGNQRSHFVMRQIVDEIEC